MSETSGGNDVIRSHLLNHLACLLDHAAAERSAVVQISATSTVFITHVFEKQLITHVRLDLSVHLFVVYITTST